MLKDRDISATSVLAGALWTIGALVIVIDFWVDPKLVGIGLWLTGAGMVFSIRRMFCQQCSRERNAFELGRDVERDRLHSV